MISSIRCVKCNAPINPPMLGSKNHIWLSDGFESSCDHKPPLSNTYSWNGVGFRIVEDKESPLHSDDYGVSKEELNKSNQRYK